MNNIVDITARLERRKQYEYESGSAAITRARDLADVLLENTSQLLIPVSDVLPAICELRAIVRGEAHWPTQHPERNAR